MVLLMKTVKINIYQVPKPLFQDKDLDFRGAFLAAVDEYNTYGAAAHSAKWRIDDDTAAQMYGFKAGFG